MHKGVVADKDFFLLAIRIIGALRRNEVFNQGTMTFPDNFLIRKKDVLNVIDALKALILKTIKVADDRDEIPVSGKEGNENLARFIASVVRRDNILRRWTNGGPVVFLKSSLRKLCAAEDYFVGLSADCPSDFSLRSLEAFLIAIHDWMCIGMKKRGVEI